MNNWKIDVAVCLIFFVRDDTFSKVFESVRLARPKTLLLWQDGPRPGRPDDLEGIERCRKIAENIDWDCTVYRNYHEENMGCDPSTFYADKWAFSIVDKCIILEDDQVPTQSFYPYCKELLDRYENDERISHICGYNYLGEYENYPYDYLFAFTGTGAWASWRRVAQSWDEEYTFLSDNNAMTNIQKLYDKRSTQWISCAQRHKDSGRAHWESIIGMGAHLNSRYAIVPRVNLVQNLGVSANATHSVISDPKLIPDRVKRFYVPGKDITFPLRHPRYVLPEYGYIEQNEKIQTTSVWLRLCDRIEISLKIIQNYGFREFLKIVRKRK